MKQGKTEKAVFAKLSTQKVELSMASVLEGMVKRARNAEGDMVLSYIKAQDFSKAGIRAAEKHLMNLKEIKEMADSIKTDAKNLGIDFTSIKGWRDADDFLNGNPEGPTEKIVQQMKGLL